LSQHPRVATIPVCTPFITTLVQATLDGSLGLSLGTNTRDFSEAIIYVPTRRAARALAHAFATALRPEAVLLPRIIPLGDPADLDTRMILSADGLTTGEAPPAIPDVERRLLLTQLIEAWRNSRDLRTLDAADDDFRIGGSFADSFGLAGDLASLIDEFAVEGIDWRRVDGLAPEQFDTYWQLTREFLAIAGTAWPAALVERGVVDPAERMNMLLRAEAKRLTEQPPEHPVIAAGSTGSVPATAELLSTIARLPLGAVILPGLDQEMDDHAWSLVGEDPLSSREGQVGHPQTALKRLLERIGVSRHDVISLGVSNDSRLKRRRILSAVLTPAEATSAWPDIRSQLAGDIAESLAGVSVIETSDERMEAAAIATALRETLETPEATAALMTPDRALAQRVMSELKRWGVEADDSAGQPLAMTSLAILLRLITEGCRDGLDASAMLAILHHPLVTLGLDTADFLAGRTALELAGLRNNPEAHGLKGLAQAAADMLEIVADRHAPHATSRLAPAGIACGQTIATRLGSALAPLCEAAASQPIGTWIEQHLAALSQLVGDVSTYAEWTAIAGLFDELAASSGHLSIALGDYTAITHQLLAERPAPPVPPKRGRIKIWGLLEARLMEADRVVLGGLNERIWPPDAKTDAFLNRGMRAALGLSPPERRIGQTAHDFVMAFGAPDVLLTRAMTVEGSPTVASRFLRRLEAFAGQDAAKAMRNRGQRYIDWAEALDDAPRAPQALRPDPRPPAAVQPPGLSITEISRLYRDPYAIYAKHILKLEPAPPISAGIDARDRGQVIHDVLAGFVVAAQQGWPDDPLADLLARGEKAFQPLMREEQVRVFWWPVFKRTAEEFIAWESERRKDMSRSITEQSGRIVIPLENGTSFELRGRADRIDVLNNDTLAIVDYKTGAPPSAKMVFANHDPQLTLTAAMARAGAFGDVPAAPVSEIGYMQVGADTKFVKIEDKDKERQESVEQAATRHLTMLISMLNQLRSGALGYTSRRMPQYLGDRSDYDHLARVREWAQGDDE
jgi:ATP-dependent helicase/nuclease subunit B